MEGTIGTLTAKPASTPMASHGITAPKCAVTICASAPDVAMAVRSAKSMSPARISSRGKKDREKREQQRHRTCHCVNEELRGCGTASWTTPQFDEEERGDEAQLPEQKPVKEIERGKGAEEARFENQDEAIEKAGMWCTRCDASTDMSVTMAESKSMSAPSPSTPR